MQIALGNILKFRKKNWQFDFIGGIIYFALVFSMFPQVSFSGSSLFWDILHLLSINIVDFESFLSCSLLFCLVDFK